MNKNTNKIIPYVLATTTLFVAGTSIALAADSITNYVPLTSIPGLFKSGVATNPVSVMKGLYGLAIGAGSVIAVVMIVLAGFKYMYEESISGKSGAKEQIENAFLGLLVILGSYILLRTVNAELVNFNPVLPGGTGRVAGLVAADQANADAVKSALATYQSDLANIAKTVDPIKGQVDSIKLDIQNIDKSISNIQASTTLSAADKQSRITNLQTAKTTAQENLKTAEANLATAQTAAATLRNTAEDNKLKTINQVAISQLEAALAKGDNAAATGIIQRVNSVYSTEEQRRGGSTPSLEALKGELSVLTSQALISGAKANVVNNMINRTDGYTPDYPAISRVRADLVSKAQASINTIKNTDQAAAAKITTELNNALASIDSAVAAKTNCKSYTSTPEGYQCTNY